jgi:hypothetical protein
MSDDLGPLASIIAAIVRGIRAPAAAAIRPQPKLNVTVHATRESAVMAIFLSAKVTNEGDASITIDEVSSHIRASRGRHGIHSVKFKSDPVPPFRLESYSSAEWTAKIPIKNQWMLIENIDCTIYVAGAGMCDYRRKKVVRN